MMEKKFEIIITGPSQDKKTIVVNSVPFTLGFENSAQLDLRIFKLQGSGLKSTFVVEDEKLLIKVTDPSYAIEINNKHYKTARLKKDIVFNLGPLTIDFRITEIHNDDIIPNLPDFDDTNPQIVISSLKPQSQIQSDGAFSFNIHFNEAHYIPSFDFPYQDETKDFTGYIDPCDETVKKLPTDDFIEKDSSLGIHIAHVHNGTTLSEKYFSANLKNIFISQNCNKKNYFQVHDSAHTSEQIIHNRQGKTMIVGLDGYDFQLVDKNGQIIPITDSTTTLLEKERIVFSKGLSQIIIKKSLLPPKLKKDSPLEINEKLLAIMAFGWAIIFIPLVVVMMTVNIPEPIKKQENIVILKRKVQPVKKAESEKTSQASIAQAMPQATPPAIKQIQPVKTETTQKKVSLKQPVKVATTKQLSKAASLSNTSVKAVQPQKTYQFNSTAQMKNILGNKLANANTLNNRIEIAAPTAIGSASNFPSQSAQNLGKVKNNLTQFNTGGGDGSGSVLGARGLSGKVATETSYSEGHAKVLGSLDPNLIRKIMREYIPQFRYCYQQEILRNEDVAGVFDLDFNINAKGKGIDVRVNSQGVSFSSQGRDCLRKVVNLIQFPKPPGGNLVDVRQPLNFQQNRNTASSNESL